MASSGCNSPTLNSQTEDDKKRDSVDKNIVSEPSTSADKYVKSNIISINYLFMISYIPIMFISGGLQLYKYH